MYFDAYICSSDMLLGPFVRKHFSRYTAHPAPLFPFSLIPYARPAFSLPLLPRVTPL